MIIAILSEDVRFCSDLATVCFENNFEFIFINNDLNNTNRDVDCIILDLDQPIDHPTNNLHKNSEKNSLVIGVKSIPKKSDILKAKTIGCLMVLAKTNFKSNLVDVVNRFKG